MFALHTSQQTQTNFCHYQSPSVSYHTLSLVENRCWPWTGNGTFSQGPLTFISLSSRVKRRFTYDLLVSRKPPPRWTLAQKSKIWRSCVRCRKCTRIFFQKVCQAKMWNKCRRKFSGCSTSSCLGCPRRTAGRCVWPGATECPLKLRTCAVNVAITCASFVLQSTWARTRTCITRLSPGCCFSALCRILTHFVCIFFKTRNIHASFPPRFFLAVLVLLFIFFFNTQHIPASSTHQNLLTVIQFKICS